MKSNAKSLTPDPQEIWENYRDAIYERPLNSLQEREMQITFYAGIETLYRILDRLVDHQETGDPQGDAYQAFKGFRREVQVAANLVNLDRANGDS